MRQVAEQVFAVGGNQRYLSLRKDEIVRQLTIRNDWTRIRVGLLYAIEGSQTIYDADFQIGVCNYGTNGDGLLSWNCPNWVGGGFCDYDGSTNLTYTAGTNASFNTPSYSTYRVGGSRSWFGGNVTPLYHPAIGGGATPRRGLAILQVTKGSPNYVCAMWGTFGSSQVNSDWNYNQLLEATQQINSPPLVGSTSLTAWAASGTGAFSETPGVLDSVSVAWKNMTYALEIYGLAVYRVY